MTTRLAAYDNPAMSEPVPVTTSVIETDTFCEGCGFNLFTQPVWRDQRLGILVCRCPECGRHQHATGRSTVGTVWLNRLATAALLAWVLSVVMFVIAVFVFLVSHHAVAEDALTFMRMETPDGLEAEYIYNGGTVAPIWVRPGTATTVPTEYVRAVRHLRGWLPGGAQSASREYQSSSLLPVMRAGAVASLFVFLLIGCSAVLASASWFWKRGRVWCWLLLPVLAIAFVLMVSADSGSGYYGLNTPADNSLARKLYTAVLAAQLLVMAFGLLVGRPLARLALSIFIPPKARQVFAFLWLCDGKTPPTTRAAGGAT